MRCSVNCECGSCTTTFGVLRCGQMGRDSVLLTKTWSVTVWVSSCKHLCSCEMFFENMRLLSESGIPLILSFLSLCCRSDHVKRGQYHSSTKCF